MLKRIAYAAVTMGLMASAAEAVVVEFRGSMCLVATTARCAAEGWRPGSCLVARYSPPNVGTNGPTTKLSAFVAFFAEHYFLAAGNPVGPTFKRVEGTKIGRGVTNFVAQMRFSAQTPAQPTPSTPFLNITGLIQTFDGLAGCNVTFRAALMPRPQ